MYAVYCASSVTLFEYDEIPSSAKLKLKSDDVTMYKFYSG